MNEELRKSQIRSSGSRPPAEHDASYKRMFSHREMVIPFLRKFVLRGAKGAFDLSTLEPVKSDFISSEHQKRDSDAVWRLRLTERVAQSVEWAYVYIQLEFQSKPQRFMAVRALNYLCMLYEGLANRGEVSRDGRLPPVLPIVLYNGSRPWRKPVSLEELIAPAPKAFKAYLPTFKFLLIDEGQWPKEDLDPSGNPASALFSLEQARQNEEVLTGVRHLFQSTQGPSMESLRSDMVKWLMRSLLPLRFPDQDPLELLENQNMLAETVKEWTTEWLAQGREEGLRETLTRLLRTKFGESASEFDARLAGADESTLSLWIDRLLVASSLEEVFED